MTRHPLVLPLLVAALLRIALIAFATPVIEGDGTEYCRLAESLLEKGDYLGMLPGRELMFPPLHPLAIAGVKSLSGWPTPLCARLISAVSGLLTLLFLGLSAGRIGGPRQAALTAWLVALLPGLTLAATATYCESLQLALLCGGLYFGQRCVASRGLFVALLSGLCFGLAYLARVEGLAVGFLAALLLALGPGPVGGWKRRFLPPALLVVVMMLTLLPYPLYLRDRTGSFRFEGKSERVSATVERFATGVPYWEANYAIDAEGKDLGPWLSPNRKWKGDPPEEILERSASEIGAYMLKNLRTIAKLVLTGHTMSSLLFLLLFPIAWRFRWRDREQLFVDLCLLGLASYSVLVMAFYKPVLRYLLPLALGSALWGGRAIDRLVKRISEGGTWLGLSPARWQIVGVILLALSAARPLVRGSFQEYDESRASHLEVKELGLRLARRPEPGVLMGHETRLAYYAGRTWVPLPLAPTEQAFRARLRELKVSLFTLRISEKDPRPGPWFDPDHPPPDMEAVDGAGVHRVYRVR